MAGRRNVGIMCGNITFNGMSRSHCCIGYCQSYDLHIGELSVYQNLYYSCQLRSSISLTSQEIYDKCFYVANIVGLHTAFDTMVGNILIKGISGGQQKLLSIATELLGNPDVFFLDEVILLSYLLNHALAYYWIGFCYLSRGHKNLA